MPHGSNYGGTVKYGHLGLRQFFKGATPRIDSSLEKYANSASASLEISEL